MADPPATDSSPADSSAADSSITDPVAAGSLRVQIETFEGPFDLLLHLVRVNEMDIFDISIAEITDQYLAHLARMEHHNLEIAGDFLVMAATLLNIKSRTVLPENPHLDDEEEGEGEAILTTGDLVRQLIEYRRFKEIGQVLGERETAQMKVFYRTRMAPRRDDDEPEIPPQEIDALLAAFARVAASIGLDHSHEILEDEVSVEDTLARVRDMVRMSDHCRLSDLFQACRTRQQMVVTVLALLEMVRLAEIRIAQTACYEDVHITRRDDSPPPPPPQPLPPVETHETLTEETPEPDHE